MKNYGSQNRCGLLLNIYQFLLVILHNGLIYRISLHIFIDETLQKTEDRKELYCIFNIFSKNNLSYQNNLQKSRLNLRLLTFVKACINYPGAN